MSSILNGSSIIFSELVPTTLQDLLLQVTKDNIDGAVSIRQSFREDRYSIGYHDLEVNAQKVAGTLRMNGYVPGTKVIILQDDIKAFLITFWGCILSGVVPVLLNYQTIINNIEKLKTVWNDFGRVAILTSGELVSKLVGYFPKDHDVFFTIEDLIKGEKVTDIISVAPNDIALLFLTSGSTKNSKYVVQTHKSILSSILGIIEKNHFSYKDIFFGWLPLGHAAPLIINHLIPMFLRAQQYHVSMNMILENPYYWLECLSDLKATMSWAPNFAYKLLIDISNQIKGKNLDLSTVQCLMNAGELVTKETLYEFSNIYSSIGFKKSSLRPAYGMAETCSAITWTDASWDNLWPRNGSKFVPVGAPIPGVSLRIVDEFDHILPIGMIGNLQVNGEAITKGYYYDGKIDRKDFSSDGWFTTGDLAFIENEQLYITGRDKDIIIVNGEKYFNHEIETIVDSVDGVVPTFTAACGVRLENEVTEQLAIFFNTEIHKTEINELSDKIRQTVLKQIGLNPRYIIPLEKEKIPKTDIGKIQRLKLQKQFESGLFSKYMSDNLLLSEVDLKLSKNEEILHNICANILKKKSIDLKKSFFSQGGTSLEAIRLIGKLYEYYNIKISLSDFFSADNLISILNFLEKRNTPSVKQEKLGKISGLPKQLSPLQKGIWVTSELLGSQVYNLNSSIELTGTLNLVFFEQAVNEIIASNRIFSSYYQYDNTTDSVKIEFSKNQTCLKTYDLSIYNEDERKKRGEEIASKILSESIKLSEPYLLKASLIKYKNNKYLFIIAAHHLIFDGYSFDVFYQKIATLYNSLCSGAQKTISSSLEFTDFIQWYDSKKHLSCLQYWRSKIKGYIPVKLQTDFADKNIKSTRCESLTISLDGELQKNIYEFCRNNNVSVYVVLLLAYYIVIHYFSSYQEDLTVCIPVSLRDSEQLESILGLMINTLPLRFSISLGSTLRELLNGLKNEFIALYENKDTAVTEILDEISADYRKDLFNILFTYVQSSIDTLDFNGVKIKVNEEHTTHMEHHLCLVAYELRDIITIKIQYNTDLFIYDTAASMINFYNIILTKLIDSPDIKIRDLNLIDEQTLINIPQYCQSGIIKTIATQSIPSVFEKQVEKTPQSIAILDGDKSLNYEDLNYKANYIASLLIQKGILQGDYIAVCIKRSAELIVAMMAILKVGAVYVPVSHNLPKERIEFIINDTTPKLIIVDKKDFSFDNSISEIMVFPEILVHQQYKNCPNLNIQFDSYNPAYIIYTSGSTGTPNGILLNHATILNLTQWQRTQSGFKDNYLTLSQFADVAFDVSLQEIFQALTLGNRLVIVPEDVKKDMAQLTHFVDFHEINILYLPTVILTSFITEAINEKRAFKFLQKIIIAGSVFKPNQIIKTFFETNKNIRLINQYGPAETHVVTSYQLPESTRDWTEISNIGSAIANTGLLVCSPGGGVLPFGVPGELLIQGISLARCYVNNPQLTAKKFVNFDFIVTNLSGSNASNIFYRTGDQVKWLPNGELAFLGRLDKQVKIRGYRVEISEVENLICEHNNIKESAVTTISVNDEFKLVAYVVLKNKKNFSTYVRTLKDYLATKLPAYAIPNYIINVPNIPKNTSGKIDYKALPTYSDNLLDNGLSQEEYPKSIIEKQIHEIWCTCLQVKAIGINDNFFYLGGDSVTCIKVSSLARQMGLFLSSQDIYEFPTIALLAKKLESLTNPLLESSNPNIAQQNFNNNIFEESMQKLTPIQKGMLFHVMYSDTGTEYHTQLNWNYNGTLDPILLREAWSKVLSNNPILRKNFDWNDNNEPIQTVATDFELPWVDLNWSNYDEKVSESLKKELLEKDLNQPHNFKKGLLTRFYLIQQSKNHYFFIWNISHLLVDGWSLMLVLEELHNIYYQLVNGKQSKAVERVDFSKYVDWIYSQSVQNAKTFWHQRLANFSEPTQLKINYAPFSIHSTGRDIQFEEVQFTRQFSHNISSFAKKFNITVNVLISLAWALILSVYNDTNKVLLGIVNSGRSIPLSGIEEMIGLFINTLPLSIDLSDHSTILNALQYLHKEFSLVGKYGYVSLKEIQAESAIAPIESLFYALLIFQNYPMDIKLDKTLPFSVDGLGIKGFTNYPLTITVYFSDEFRINITYDSSCFSAIIIKNMIKHIEETLGWILNNVNSKPNSVKIFSETDRDTLTLLNKPKELISNFDSNTVFKLFEKTGSRK